MKLLLAGFVIIILVFSMIAAGSAAKVGGDQGWYEFHCQADGAKVMLDDKYVGDIANGVLVVPIYTTGTPYSTYTVTYQGCVSSDTITRSLPGVPAKGQTIDIYVDIEPDPCPTPTPKLIGGDKGYYMIWSNEDGVTISFDGEDKGMTKNGYLQIQVAVTGTPYKTMTATKPGYITVSEAITEHPSAGETIDMYVTMKPDIIVAATNSGNS